MSKINLACYQALRKINIPEEIKPGEKIEINNFKYTFVSEEPKNITEVKIESTPKATAENLAYAILHTLFNDIPSLRLDVVDSLVYLNIFGKNNNPLQIIPPNDEFIGDCNIEINLEAVLDYGETYSHASFFKNFTQQQIPLLAKLQLYIQNEQDVRFWSTQIHTSLKQVKLKEDNMKSLELYGITIGQDDFSCSIYSNPHQDNMSSRGNMIFFCPPPKGEQFTLQFSEQSIPQMQKAENAEQFTVCLNSLFYVSRDNVETRKIIFQQPSKSSDVLNLKGVQAKLTSFNIGDKIFSSFTIILSSAEASWTFKATLKSKHKEESQDFVFTCAKDEVILNKGAQIELSDIKTFDILTVNAGETPWLISKDNFSAVAEILKEAFCNAYFEDPSSSKGEVEFMG